jgi:hypothetical protein
MRSAPSVITTVLALLLVAGRARIVPAINDVSTSRSLLDFNSIRVRALQP